ncbi:MAG: MBL fold metallo-hydrolase [Pseudolabrys sp.]|nr:MBL fold metallo-hydrolase [Pseudolabrys sp.]
MNRSLMALGLVVLGGPAFAQAQPTPPVGPDFSKIEVKTIELGKDTYMLEGAGGNVTVAVGKDGIIMVDGQFAPMHDKLKAAIAKISPLPIKYLVNTHHHGDHTGGNAAFVADGATVVGQTNEANFLKAGTTSNTTMQKVPPVDAAAVPKMTYEKRARLEVKGRTAQLTHPLSSHTGGDTYVYFKDANVLSTGDTFTNGRYPNIDYLNGGSINGMIEANTAYLALSTEKTKIVPGHGPLGTRADVRNFRLMLETARDRMAKLIKDGKSEQEIYDAKPFADLDAKWAPNEQAGKNFMRVVYTSVKESMTKKKSAKN